VTGDQVKFAKLSLKDEGFVNYGDNNEGKILGTGVINNGSLIHHNKCALVIILSVIHVVALC